MLCTHSICCVKWFLSAKAGRKIQFYTMVAKPLAIPCSDFFVCWCLSGFSNPPHPQKSGVKRPCFGWPLIHDSALKVSAFKSNCPASRRRAAAVLPRANSMSPGQLWEVNTHFSQLSRTCDGGKRTQRSTEVTALHISGGFEILNCVIKEAENTSSTNTTFKVLVL